MGKAGCAVPNCRPSKVDARHRFPHPLKLVGLFIQWLQVINNADLKNLDHNVIYEKYRVCDKHFVKEDHVANNRLNKLAYPKLHVPSIRNLDHPYAKPADQTCSISSSSSSTSSPVPSTSSSFPTSSENIFENILTSGHENYCNPFPIHHDHCYLKTSTLPGLRSKTITSKHGLLKCVGKRKSCDLSSDAKRMYKQAVYYKKRASKLTKRKVELKRKLVEIEKWSTEKSFLNLTKHFNRTASHFFKSQIRSFGKKSKGRRFNTEDKILALALYKQSPVAYKLLSALFVLPSRVTLQKMLSRIPIFPGIHETVFTTLKSVSRKMKPLNKYCVLMFDEMSIEPHLHYNQFLDEVDGLEDFGTQKMEKIANHVQVYMLRGIADNWKQPVGYFFVNGGVKATQLKQIIVSIIRKATEAGLTVVATVCDQGSNNKSAINSLVTETQQKKGSADYAFDVDSNKIIPLFDGPHLLKSFRNILLNKDIFFTNENGQTRVAKWSHIEKTWEHDSYSGELRAMPRVTEFHVNKSKVKKMKVSIAAQVFSHSVAATMNLLINNGSASGNDGTLNEGARGTVDLIKFMDNTFDSVNGSAKRDTKGKPLRTSAVTEDNSLHEEYWSKAIKIFGSMYVMENRQKKVMPCFKNWQITLSGFIYLRKKLKEYGFLRIKTRRFNQDPLENLFGRIRQRGQRFTRPTCTAFGAFYKSLLVNGLVSKHSVGSNCEDDESNILVSLQRFITQVFI